MFVTPGFAALPPNVATKLVTSASLSPAATYTCVVSYCAPTAMTAEAAAVLLCAIAASGTASSVTRIANFLISRDLRGMVRCGKYNAAPRTTPCPFGCTHRQPSINRKK
jgi:hypothetical protein